jgi:hypothetical protein
MRSNQGSKGANVEGELELRSLTKLLQSIGNTVWLIIGRKVAELPPSCNRVLDVTSVKNMRYYSKTAYSPSHETFLLARLESYLALVSWNTRPSMMRTYLWCCHHCHDVVLLVVTVQVMMIPMDGMVTITAMPHY